MPLSKQKLNIGFSPLMNLPFEKSPGFCSVGLMDSFGFEYDGWKYWGLEKRQAGQVGHNLQLRWLSGQFFLSRLIKGRGRSFDKISQAGDRRSYASTRTSFTNEFILAVKPGVLKFSAESIIGMNTAALSTLHKLPVGNALRIQGALASCDRGSRQLPLILGGGGSQERGPYGMGPNIHPGAQAGCLVLLAGECLL
jgi:hypothetical protein